MYDMQFALRSSTYVSISVTRRKRQKILNTKTILCLADESYKFCSFLENVLKDIYPNQFVNL